MTQDVIERYRQMLDRMRERLNGNVNNLAGEAFRQAGGEASGNLSNAPLHLADLGTDTFEQEMSLTLLETEEQRLEEIAAALTRIAQGHFGRCEECSQAITRQRLDAIPYTRYCVDCAHKVQAENGHMEGGRIPNPGNL